MNEVAVTGLGVVCPLGNDAETFGRRMFAGESGVCDLRGGRLAADFPVPHAGPARRDRLEVPGLPGSGRRPSSWDGRRFAAASAAQAVAGLPPDTSVDSIVFGVAESLDFPLVRESFRRDPRRESSGFPWTDGARRSD